MRNYSCNKTLRTLQQECMDALNDDFDAGNQKLLVVAPTGLGKSAIMGGMSKYHLDNNPNEVVIVASHLGLVI